MAWEITDDDDQLEAKHAAEVAEINQLQQETAFWDAFTQAMAAEEGTGEEAPAEGA